MGEMDMTGVLAVSTAELSLRMGVALAVVLTILFAGVSIARRRGGRTGRSLLVVEHQQQLTKHTVLSLVTVGEQQLLVASNPQATTLLAQGPSLMTRPQESGGGVDLDIRGGAAKATAKASTGARASAGARQSVGPLKQLQNKTVRRA
jgi:flagellar biogenesis protein FliO